MRYVHLRAPVASHSEVRALESTCCLSQGGTCTWEHLLPLTVRYMRLRAPVASHSEVRALESACCLSHIHGLKLSLYTLSHFQPALFLRPTYSWSPEIWGDLYGSLPPYEFQLEFRLGISGRNVLAGLHVCCDSYEIEAIASWELIECWRCSKLSKLGPNKYGQREEWRLRFYTSFLIGWERSTRPSIADEKVLNWIEFVFERAWNKWKTNLLWGRIIL